MNKPPNAPRVSNRVETTLPVAHEELGVHKRQVETGRVRVHKTVSESEQVVHEQLSHDDVEVERVAVNREIDAPMEPRKEGDTLIIPVIEEVVEVRKKLMLREEIRVTRRTTERAFIQRVPVRQEQATVERQANPGSGASKLP
jgi:uncharacterized protein (TIGR02271 family)